MPALINPTDDPLFPGQSYIRGRRGNKRGIYANFAWDKPGGDGTGVGIVFVESSWQLDHEDLVGAGITLISGVNPAANTGTAQQLSDAADAKAHGTNVVGEVMAQDNNKGIVGIAPKARARVISQERTPGNFNVAAAIVAGVLAMERGDVMNISLQTAGKTIAAGGFRPLEIIDLNFWAIKLGTVLGRIICTAAGNGNLDLDTLTNAAGQQVLNRGNHAQFRDSGAIMVAAATATRPHVRVSGPNLATNFGSRIDCFAQGRDICTTSSKVPVFDPAVKNLYIPDFHNTSGATPIVAGAAVLTQAMAKSRSGHVITPAQIRSVLSGTQTSIRSANPTTDRIGRMPNMQLIFSRFIETLPRRASTRARTHALYAGRNDAERPQLFLDPGHGGEQPAGRSTAYGGRGPSGVREKDITLEVARSAQGRFGYRSVLSRDGDYNVSLEQRLASARHSRAPAFVSVHADSGATQGGGPEVWVYRDEYAGPDPRSMALAENIRNAVAANYGRPVRIREGRLALLRPAYHGPNVAACLVEAGSLADPDDELRLSNPGTADTIGAAIARGVEAYIGTVPSDDESDAEDTQYGPAHTQSLADSDDYTSEPMSEGSDYEYDPGGNSGAGEAYA
jgi:N-acetylmuramoyl-L-alanine amidase